MVEPVSASLVFAVKAATSALQLAKAAGLVKTASDRMLEGIAADVRGLVEAPFHEGLHRLGIAHATSDPTRRAQLLAEAREKLQDAAAGTRVPRNLAALACLYCSGFAKVDGHDDEAREWMRQALDAIDVWMGATYEDARTAAEAFTDDRKAFVLAIVRTAANPVSGAADGIPRLVKYRRAIGRLPSTTAIEEVNGLARAMLGYAREIGVDTDGRCERVELKWRWNRWLVAAELTRVVPPRTAISL